MNLKTENLIEELILSLPSVKDQHARTTDTYSMYYMNLRTAIESLFNDSSEIKKPFGPFGEIVFPYFKMGNRSSLDLFDLDEFIIFSFYWQNRTKYKKVLDIGANIGLHTLILSKCGFHVESFEPDPIHFNQLKHNLDINQAKNVKLNCGAVSSAKGQAEFVRVLGNTTSSHLAGCKNPYGDLEKFMVELFDIHELIRSADFIKMDVEGHEDQILLATHGCDWDSTDAIVEVGDSDKALSIFNHFKNENVNLFAQKIGWQRVSKFDDMPMSYKEGSLFISKKTQMPWE